MEVRRGVGAAWVILLSGGMAWGQGMPAEAPLTVAAIVRATEAQVASDAQALLARQDLNDPDRQKITELLQRAHAAADQAVAAAGANTLDPKATPEELGAVVAEYVKPVNSAFNLFVTPRADLDWMRSRAAAIVAVEDKMLAQPTGDYANVVREAEIGASKAAGIAAILERCRADLDKQNKLMMAAYVLADAAGKQKVLAEGESQAAEIRRAARAAVRARLSAEEVAALDWQFLKEYQGIPDYAKLGFSTQGQMWKAPEDGVYVLEESPGRKQLAKVTLKKGAVMGFNNAEGVATAMAGGKGFLVPAGAVVYWMRAAEE